MVGKELLALAKPSLRIINVSRGGVIDEDALAEAIREGRIGGAAIDVFATEPTTSSPLFELPQVVVTPHLGASTAEAQDKAGDTIAEQVGARPRRRVRALRRQRRAPPRRRAPSARSCRSPSGSASSTPGWPRASPTPSRSATRASWPTPTPASSRSRCSRACSGASARSR